MAIAFLTWSDLGYACFHLKMMCNLDLGEFDYDWGLMFVWELVSNNEPEKGYYETQLVSYEIIIIIKGSNQCYY